MPTGMIDSSVRDKALGLEILTLFLGLVKPGSHVRVGSKSIKVDKSRVVRYSRIQGQEEEYANNP